MKCLSGRFTAAAMVMLAVTACSGASTGPRETDGVPTVIVRMTTSSPSDFFDGPSDSMAVNAVVSDRAGNVFDRLPVTWRLELPNGAAIGDTIATVISTGPQTATVVFYRDALVGIVARVNDNSGVERKGSLFVSWSRDF